MGDLQGELSLSFPLLLLPVLTHLVPQLYFAASGFLLCMFTFAFMAVTNNFPILERWVRICFLLSLLPT